MYINTDDLKTQMNVDLSKFSEIAEILLADFYDKQPDFTLMFVEPEVIRTLNRDYRQTDAVTDVLSFESGGEIDPETGNEYLGDIVICVSRAQEQADRSGHSLENELALLEIHGLLHLLGYDHIDEAQKAEMWQYQDEYLEKCGIVLGRRPGEDFDF